MMIRLLLIVLLGAPFAHAQATQPEPTVAWQERHTLRGMHGRMTLLDAGAGAGGDGGYRVVGSSGFRNADKSFTEQWWMLSLDAHGRKRNLKEFIAKGNQAGIHAAFALPKGRTLAIGGMLDWIAEVDAAGALQPAHRIHAGDFDTSVSAAVADKADSLLVAGSRTVSYAERPSLVDAWLARIKHDGTVVWQKSFDRAHMDAAAAILPLRDGGCVLAINSGKYNKFGAGPTALWLVRCDADGNKIADAVIDGAQIYPGGQKYLVPLAREVRDGDGRDGDDGGFVVSYTVGQLSGGMQFEAHLRAFDSKLAPLWSRKLTTLTAVGSMLIVRRGADDADADADIVAVGGAIGGSPLVLFLDPRDAAVRRQITLPFTGNFDVKDVLDQLDGVVVAAAFQERDRARERDLEQDVVVLKVR